MPSSSPAESTSSSIPPEGADAITLPQDWESLGIESEGQRSAKRILPWISSIALHLFLIAIGFLIPWTTQFLFEDDDSPVAIVADFNELKPGLLTLDQLSADGQQSQADSAQATEFDIPLPPSQFDSTEELSIDTDLAGPSTENDAMNGFAPSGSGEDVSFGGLRGSNAKNIVYIVDASGSMMPYLPIVIDELIRSIDQLTDEQNFGVIFFQNNEAILVPAPSSQGRARKTRGKYNLLPASTANKLHVFDWIDLDHVNIRATGKSNPIKAIELALDGLHPSPNVIFLLSTDITGVGEYEVDQRDLLRLIERKNRARGKTVKAVIKTIQFIDDDPLETLKIIAEQNGGVDGYKFLSREDLGLQ